MNFQKGFKASRKLLQTLSVLCFIRFFFSIQVARKTNAMIIGRLEAETEVFIDRLIKREGDSDKALLYVVSEMTVESRVCN